MGDGGCGKTTLLKMLSLGTFHKKCRSTPGYSKVVVNAHTTANEAPIMLEFTKFSGQKGHVDGHNVGGDGGIIYWDAIGTRTYGSVSSWWYDLTTQCGGDTSVPFAVVCNKVEEADTLKIFHRYDRKLASWLSADQGPQCLGHLRTSIKGMHRVRSPGWANACCGRRKQ